MLTGFPVGGPSSILSRVSSAPVKPFRRVRRSSSARHDENRRSSRSMNSMVRTLMWDCDCEPLARPLPIEAPTWAV